MIDFGIKDAIDILIVASMLYYIYKMMKESGTIKIFNGVLAFIVVWVVFRLFLDMKLLGAIMDKFISLGLLVLVILFQEEIRRFLFELGSQNRWKFLFGFYVKMIKRYETLRYGNCVCLHEYVKKQDWRSYCGGTQYAARKV